MNFLNSFFENTEDDQAMNVDAEDNAQTIREKRLKLLESKTTTKTQTNTNTKTQIIFSCDSFSSSSSSSALVLDQGGNNISMSFAKMI